MKYLKYLRKSLSFGFLAVLALLLSVMISNNIFGQGTTDQALESLRMNSLYQQTHALAQAENSLLNNYYINQDATTLQEQRASMRALLRVLNTIKQQGDAGDRAFVAHVLPVQQHFQATSDLLVTALQAHEMLRASALHDQQLRALASTLEQQTRSATQADHDNAVQNMAVLYQTQHLIETLALLMLSLILLLFVTLWQQQRRSRQTLKLVHQEQLEEVAFIDSLTRSGNHRAYQEEGLEIFKQAKANQDALALAIIDIDEFKMLNEISGHAHGDWVLSVLADLLRTQVTEERHIYRLAADQFLLLLPRLSLIEAITQLEGLRQALSQCLSEVTISAGVALMQGETQKIEHLYEQAEAALYEAKRRGRDRVLTYQEVGEQTTFISATKARALRRLLAEGKITVAFQPIWEVDGRVPLAFEALTRIAGDYGFSGPQEVFDLADRLGHGPDLDRVCIHAILARASELPGSAKLFINLAPQSLESDIFQGTRFAQAVVEAGLSPERIVLEITERSMIHPEVIVREATRLHEQGFGLALDDTGSGNAGLEVLSQLPVDFVKVDRAVVTRAMTEPRARGVLAGIAAIAQQMPAIVIAEGIENLEMFDMVRKMQVQAVQGYLLGRPSPVIPSEQELESTSPLAQVA